MKPFKKTYPKVERFNTPYPKSVLRLYPRLTKYPWNGRIIGDGYGTPTGTPILSPTPGTVTFAGTDSTGSKTVDYTYKGMRVRMGHHSRVDAKRGQKLGWQTQVGLSGKSGMATHPHLYFEVAKKVGKKWVRINPDIVVKMSPPKPKGIGKALASELGSRLLGRAWTASVSFYSRNMEQFIQAIINSIEYKKKRGTDPCAVVRRELKVRVSERDTERKAKESYAKRLVQVEKDNIALNSKVAYYGGRIDKLLEKMGQDEKDTKRLMENSTLALVEKEKRVKELESLVEKLTADASIGKSVIEIGVSVKKLLKTIWGRLGKD